MVYVNPHTDRLNLAECLQQVSAQRREQALRFRHEEGRRLSVGAWLLLWQGLQQEYGFTVQPQLDYTSEGKPFLASRPDICFSLSHSRHVAVCAIDSQPVGIDVEVVRPLKESLARYVLSPREFSQVMASERPNWAFTRLWTMKESLLKQRGTGIKGDLKTLLDGVPPSLRFETFEAEDFVYTVCRIRN